MGYFFTEVNPFLNYHNRLALFMSL